MRSLVPTPESITRSIQPEMKTLLRTLLVLIQATVVAVVWVRVIQKQPRSFEPLIYTTGDFEGCPPEGEGGDPLLNLLKNRDIVPPIISPFEIGDLIATLPQDLPTSRRKNWKQVDTDRAAIWESKGVLVDAHRSEAPALRHPLQFR